MLLVLGKLVGRRLLTSVPLLFLVSLLLFFILRVMPADPVAMMIPASATVEDIAEIRAYYGFDRPIAEQYGIWIAKVLHGDFGESTSARTAVTHLIGAALPVTLELVISSIFVGSLIGISGGLMMFSARGTAVESVMDVLSTVMMSVPEFLWALLFVVTFGVLLPVLPFIGRIDPSYDVSPATGFFVIDTIHAGQWRALGSVLLHLVLPVLSLALYFAPGVMRVLRSSLLDVSHEEYIRMARLRGLQEHRVLLRHMLRNAFLPTLSLIGVQAGFMFGGTLLVEIIFSYPGIGNLMVTAVRNQDLPLIQGLGLTYCVVVLALNLAVDAGYLTLNPKLRLS